MLSAITDWELCWGENWLGQCDGEERKRGNAGECLLAGGPSLSGSNSTSVAGATHSIAAFSPLGQNWKTNDILQEMVTGGRTGEKKHGSTKLLGMQE